jgi:hypothetical protein
MVSDKYFQYYACIHYKITRAKNNKGTDTHTHTHTHTHTQGFISYHRFITCNIRYYIEIFRYCSLSFPVFYKNITNVSQTSFFVWHGGPMSGMCQLGSNSRPPRKHLLGMVNIWGLWCSTGVSS